MAKKEPSTVSAAHRLKRSDVKAESNTNGSEVQPGVMNVSLQVNKQSIISCFFFNSLHEL